MKASSAPDRERPQHVQELEKLLDLAEQLQEHYDIAVRRLEMYRLLEMILAATAIGFAGWLVFSLTRAKDGGFGSDLSFMMLGMIVLSVIYVAGIEYMIRRLRRRAYPDRQALHRILDLIRETENGMARSENWSALERAQFQIRLSRFEIAP